MSTTSKQAALGLFFWSLAAILFLTLFFQDGGPESFAANRPRVLLTSVAYGVGFLTHLVLIFRFRARKLGPTTVKDEWDDEVARKANGVALVTTLMFVYLTGVVLWELYRSAGVAPIGWFWFVAYVSVMAGFISHAAATLAIDLTRDRDA